MKKAPESVALLGMGLMGGSLGLALAAGSGQPVSAYARRAATRREILRRRAATAVFDHPADAVRNASMVVLCVPVRSMPDLLRAALPGIRPGTIITDVGSTKQWLIRTLTPLARSAGAWFVGSHPMAGSERDGLDAADPDLYRGAVCVLAAAPKVPVAVLARVRRFWESVGARTIRMTAAEHDSRVAQTSHLPHLAAAALSRAAARVGVRRAGPLCGSGFRDATRIADGSPAMWHDIVGTNRKDILRALDLFCGELSDLRDRILDERGERVEGWLEAAKISRRELLGSSKRI